MKRERFWDVVTIWKTGGERDSICVVIPKPIREEFEFGEGQKLFVKTDPQGRIILERAR